MSTAVAMVPRLDLQHSRWLQAIEEHASLDLRLHNVAIDRIAEIGVWCEGCTGQGFLPFNHCRF